MNKVKLGDNFGYGPLTQETANFWNSWRASSGHPGGWRVTRGYSPLEESCGKTGQVILFKTYEAAQKRANCLNGFV